MKDSEITDRVIGAAVAVHRAIGPGLLESAYAACLTAEFEAQGLPFLREVPLPIRYRELQLDCGYRLDFLVADRVVLELKSVEKLEPLHQVQLLSYLRLSGKPIGLLINFNVPRLIDGVRRLVHNYAPDASASVQPPSPSEKL